MIINKPDQLETQVVSDGDQLAVRITTPDLIRDISLDLAAYLIKELADRMAEANELLQKRAVEESVHSDVENVDSESTIRFRRLGDNYSMLKWRREYTGSYVTRATNGVKLKVFRHGKGEWYAQVGDTVINDKPLSMKVEAIELVESVLIK